MHLHWTANFDRGWHLSTHVRANFRLWSGLASSSDWHSSTLPLSPTIVGSESHNRTICQKSSNSSNIMNANQVTVSNPTTTRHGQVVDVQAFAVQLSAILFFAECVSLLSGFDMGRIHSNNFVAFCFTIGCHYSAEEPT